MPLRILLLQARNPDDPVRGEERQSFANKAGLALEQVIPWDLLEGPPSLPEVIKYEALMVGGSGDYYVSKGNLPHFPAVLDLLQEVAAVGRPTFASCFGFQLLVQALGGEIIYDPNKTEVGTYPVTLTAAAKEDELFGGLPVTFDAQFGHKDRAAIMPPGSVHLASSERCPYQALRLPGKPIWATQFHPEMNGQENRARFARYLKGYGSVMSPEEMANTLDRFYDSPETDQLIARFLKLVFGYEGSSLKARPSSWANSAAVW
jgi:GMP synthase (glutamine-hydrolysing)